jgi:hypothetical protein
MTTCASIKKKGSTEQCSAKALRGHTLCGRHARAKYITLWVDIHKNKTAKLEKLQALIRGWLVRRRLHYSGPGVLCRKNLANDEDLETCEEFSKEHPLDYFAFEENGKIWWFHFPTLWKWCLRSYEPTNPYTKVPLSQDTRKRIRSVWSYRFRNKIQLPEEPATLLDRIHGRWNIICQLFSDYGFGNIDPRMFIQMGKQQYTIVFQFLRDDMQIVFPETSKTRKFVVTQCNRILYSTNLVQTNVYILNSTYLLMGILLYPKDPYILAFTILSALYRS